MVPSTGRFAALVALLGYGSVALAAPSAASDPCVKVAGQAFVPPSDALACYKSFPFNETIRQNVLTVVDRVLNFYTFEDYYLHSPKPFQDSTVNIRAQLKRIGSTKYKTDFDFNYDLYNVVNQLNDGHTLWITKCYGVYENLLPAPVVTLEQNGAEGVYVVPDLDQFIPLLGSNFTDYFASAKFDWKRLAGARVLEIEGKDPYAYAEHIAHTQSGNYLDHGVRVNSVFSSYRISGTSYSQRFGDIAGSAFPDKDTLTMKVHVVNATKAETIKVPFLASFAGVPFKNGADFWANNCAPNAQTNGVDLKNTGEMEKLVKRTPERARRLAKASIIDKQKLAVGLPTQFEPTTPKLNGSEGVIKSYILPDGKTGVMFVSSFEPDDANAFMTDVQTVFNQFKAKGVSQLLLDLTNNGDRSLFGMDTDARIGGYVCLGHFLHAFLVGKKNLGDFKNPGFQSTMRASPLAQKILASVISLGLNSTNSFYAPSNCRVIDYDNSTGAFLNDTVMPSNYNYMTPTTTRKINGQDFIESQRIADACESIFNVDIPEEPYFALDKIAIVGNANCASTCAMFTTLMNERHNTAIANFGGKPGSKFEYKGMAGNEVLEWVDLDSEIKTANLKNDPLAPPDLLVNANIRHNWRIAYSFFDEKTPIEYKSERARFRFPYTLDTYNNPQNLWTFAASKLFSSDGSSYYA
ncbi:hypothetical protein GSI_09065 [Ganoderma sinense ZZ0214-1]|uniref:Tail specific protease domain-containing protein n=1 Tax=Ganoderma sinense ZZ0214-1 TaxID=1077348 RepID=A0A2G8S5K3_9APHY|nr:hypothetical protein GSI_09065 [Ganoderma sinense ZZ0214-1]